MSAKALQAQVGGLESRFRGEGFRDRREQLQALGYSVTEMKGIPIDDDCRE